MNKNKSFSFRKVVWDDRFLIVFSVIIAIVFWAAVCVSFASETTRTIQNVPVTIDKENSVPAKCGLQPFGYEDFTVDITVRGRRYIVGENLLDSKDFKVTVVTSSVSTAGTHSLQLKVSKVDESADFEIENISKGYVSVYYDSIDKRDIPVTVRLDKTNFVKTGYLTDENYIMDKKEVTVSGPALEIANLDSVVADVKIPEDELSRTTTCEAPLVAYNKSGTQLKYVKIDGEDNSTINISIPVYQMSSHEVDVEFTNAPSEICYNMKYKCTPSNLNIAVLQNGSQSDKLFAGKIDFSQVKKGKNSFTFPVDEIKKVKADSTGVDEVKVEFNLDSVSSKDISLYMDNISIANPPEGVNLKFDYSSVKITVYGTEEALSQLNSETIKATIDLGNNSSSDPDNEYEGPIYISDSDDCWIYGTYILSYTTNK